MVLGGTTPLDDLVISASLHVLLNRLDGDKGALLCDLPEAERAFSIVAALVRFHLFFAYRFHNSQNLSYQGKKVSCLGTVESHLESHPSLMLKRAKSVFRKITNHITYILAEAAGLITGS